MSHYLTTGLMAEKNNFINEDEYNDVEFLEIHLDERFYVNDGLELYHVSKVLNGPLSIDITKKVFYDSNQCIDYISSYQWRKIFLTITDAFVHIFPLIHDLPQIVYIYIYSQAPEKININGENYRKLRAIVNENSPDADIQIKADIDTFKRDLFLVNAINPVERKTKLYTDDKSENEGQTVSVTIANETSDDSGISISIFNKDKNCKTLKNLQEDNAQFIWFQLLIDILTRIPYNAETLDEMWDECEKHQIQAGTFQKKDFEDLRQNYQPSKALEYYTGATFLFGLLNQALRSENIDLIFIFRCFLSDMFNQLQQLYIEQFSNNSDSLDLFRGQFMNIKEFNTIKNNVERLISINQFFSTTKDYEVALVFAGCDNSDKPADIVSVVFQIEIDDTTHSLKRPFASLQELSKVQAEKEILFYPGTVFRIENVENMPTNDKNWYVQLKLINDDAENEASGLRQELEKEYCNDPDLSHLGVVLIKMGDYKKAERYFQMIVERLTRNHPALPRALSGLGIIYENRGEYHKALEYQQQALELFIQKHILADPMDNIGVSHTHIGSNYYHLGNDQLALEHFNKALQLQKLPRRNAFTYNQIAMVYQRKGDYYRALEYFQKALQIDEEVLKLDKFDPVLATDYNNIGDTYLRLKDYDNALKCLLNALEIRLKGTTPTHTDLAAIYNNLGQFYHSKNDTKQALEMYEKALEIDTQALPENHISLVTSYNNMAEAYSNCGELSKALFYQEKAFDIISKLPEENVTIDHLMARANYACSQMELGNYSKALDILETVLKTQLEKFSANSPLLIDTYMELSKNYIALKNIPKALEYLEQCLENARSSSLSINQDRIPFIEDMYERIKMMSTESDVNNSRLIIKQGDRYDNINDKRRLLVEMNEDLEQIPSTDIDERISQLNTIGIINSRQENYDAAMEAFEKAIVLYNERPTLTLIGEQKLNELMVGVYHNLARLYYRQANWLTAMQFSEKSLELALLQNEQHSLLAEIYNLLGVTCTRLQFYSKAEHCHKLSLRIAEEKLPPDHPDIQRYHFQMKQLEYLMRAYPTNVLD